MAWLHFTADVDWPQGGSWHTAYKAGMRCNVPSRFRDDLLASGAAQPMEAPSRAVAKHLAADSFWTPRGAAAADR